MTNRIKVSLADLIKTKLKLPDIQQVKKHFPFLPGWDSGHAEIRDEKKPLKEEDEKPVREINRFGVEYNSTIHDHPDVAPKKISEANKKSLVCYTSYGSDNTFLGHGSSQNINNYLRNRNGDKSKKIQGHKVEKVEKATKALSKCFTPKNTNRAPIKTYGAVPSKVGEELEKSGENSKHALPGFTSTSTDPEVAKSYALQYQKTEKRVNRKKPVKHIVHYQVEPGAGLSVAHHSRYEEDEVLLHHGAHITHVKSDKVHDRYGDHIATIHHVIVHPQHTPLEHYGEYSE